MSERTRAIIWIVVSFVFGFIIGAIVDRVFISRYYQPERKSLKNYRDELIRRLKLNENQQVKLDSILSWTKNEFKKMGDQFHLKIDSFRNVVRDSIRAMLTPEQREEFEKIVKEGEKTNHRK